MAQMCMHVQKRAHCHACHICGTGKPRTTDYHLQHEQFCSVKTSETCLFLYTHVDNVAVSHAHITSCTTEASACFCANTKAPQQCHMFDVGLGKSHRSHHWVCLLVVAPLVFSRYTPEPTSSWQWPSVHDNHLQRKPVAALGEAMPSFHDWSSLFEDWRDGGSGCCAAALLGHITARSLSLGFLREQLLSLLVFQLWIHPFQPLV